MSEIPDDFEGIWLPKGYADNPVTGLRIESPLHDRPGLVWVGTTGHIRGPISLSKGYEIRASGRREGARPPDWKDPCPCPNCQQEAGHTGGQPTQGEGEQQ